MHRPLSLIPEDIWKATPATSNGNEQAHRDVNQDGTKLSLLGGVMRGREYDHRAIISRELQDSKQIYIRDQLSTDFRRQKRAITRASESISLKSLFMTYAFSSKFQSTYRKTTSTG